MGSFKGQPLTSLLIRMYLKHLEAKPSYGYSKLVLKLSSFSWFNEALEDRVLGKVISGKKTGNRLQPIRTEFISAAFPGLVCADSLEILVTNLFFLPLFSLCQVSKVFTGTQVCFRCQREIPGSHFLGILKENILCV